MAVARNVGLRAAQSDPLLICDGDDVVAPDWLEHLVAAWEHAHPEASVAEQQVVLTVPASFDASALELTRDDP